MGILDIFRGRPRPERKSYPLYQLNPHYSTNVKWSQYTNDQAIDAYQKSVWLYSCVRLRADNISSIPWVVKVRSGDDWKKTDNHPLAELIDRPNPEIGFAGMIKIAMYWLDLTGDAWGTLVRDGGGQIQEWWPCLPDSMEVVAGTSQLVEAWKYRSGNKRKTLPVEDVVHNKYDSPSSIYYGLSPLQAAAIPVDIDQEASRFQKISLQNHGMPPGLFEGPDDLTSEQYEQARDWISEQSGPENARKPWVLGGFKFQQMGQSPHELDFILSRKGTREEICAAYAVPPPLVGIYDNATLANIQTSRRIFWLEGLIPVLRALRSQFNMQLSRQYGPDVYLDYDISNVEALTEDDTVKLARASSLWSMGVSLAEINRVLELGLDMDAIPGGDVGYLPSGLLPANFDLGLDDNDPDPGSQADADRAYGVASDGS